MDINRIINLTAINLLAPYILHKQKIYYNILSKTCKNNTSHV